MITLELDVDRDDPLKNQGKSQTISKNKSKTKSQIKNQVKDQNRGLDVDREDVRRRLLAKKQELVSRVEQTYRDIHGREERGSTDSGEQSVEMESRDLMLTLEAEARSELRSIDKALQRLADGRYGRCVHCGQTISEARLLALAYADSCMRCAA